MTWFDRSDHLRLEITGPDRARFLHNLTTNDVKRLAAGSGHEAFITSPQGKTLAYITNLATESALLIRTDPGTADSFVPHLTRYGVFDDVTIADVTAATWEFHLVGSDADAVVAAFTVDPGTLAKPLSHCEVAYAGQPIRVIRESPLGAPGWTLIGPIGGRDAITGWLATRGLPGDAATMEALRIEAGTPASGRDVSASNLPQEVGRDQQAINFVKGCYLGQETVARLDALGHVNRILCGGTIEGTSQVPAAGTSLLSADGKTVGSITSATFSHRYQAPVWLGYVRVAQAEPGSRLGIPPLDGSDGGEQEALVARLPLGS